MKVFALALLLGGILTVGLARPVEAAPASVFIDDDSDCGDPSRQVPSLPATSGVFYVWLNTGSASVEDDVYNLVLVPLTPGGTTLVGPQTATFTLCTTGTWAYAEIAYGGFEPGAYAWLVFDSAGNLLGGDTVRYN